MSWNYRVCREEYKGWDPKLHEEEDRYSLSIRSVHYADGHPSEDDMVQFTSTFPIAPHGLTLEELKEDIKKMRRALKMPVIDLDTLVYYPIETSETFPNLHTL